MSIELLKKNIERERTIVNEISLLNDRLDSLAYSRDLRAKENINRAILSLLSQLKIINNVVPELIMGIKFYPKIIKDKAVKKEKISSPNTVNVKYLDKKKEAVELAIKKQDEQRFLKNLADYHSSLDKIEDKPVQANRTGGFGSYLQLSNKIFGELSKKLVEMGYFNDIKSNLRKITSPLLASSYVSIMLFFSLVSVVFSLILALITAITGFGIGLSLVIFFIIPIVTFFSFYFYPSSKRRSLEKDINQELPFMTIYMSAIATSGIEPSKIFQIVVLSKDYPAIQREVKKLTNYINFYGYDLVSSLKLLAKNSPSEKLSQLFDGLATTITSGGELTDYLSKHSDSLLFDYRLEREKYTHVAETFMNIYISVVVAAPMILMMLFVLMSMTSLEAGSFSPSMIGLLSVLVIGLLNIGFLIFLNAKQPKF